MKLSSLLLAGLLAFAPMSALAQLQQPKSVPTPKQTPAPAPRPGPAPAPGASNQYSSESEAQQRCGSDVVVWVNSSSRVFHYAGNKSYGKTKRGAYMCKGEAERTGNRGAKNEKQSR